MTKRAPKLYTLLTRLKDSDPWNRSGITGDQRYVEQEEMLARVVVRLRTNITDATPEEIQRWKDENE